MEWYSLSFLLALLFFFLKWVNADPQVPCYFVFGDSLYDNGNNNLLPTSTKVDYFPYGIDYPDGPTGRFGNGKNIQDFIVELLGFHNPIPPFATVKEDNILQGVNYASGGAGILHETGAKKMGVHMSMDMQLDNHKKIVSKFVKKFNSKKSALNYLGKCMYSIGLGNNDYINNYYKPQHFKTSKHYTPEQYATYLLRRYSKLIKKLYKLGARKIAMFGLSNVGCTQNTKYLLGKKEGYFCVNKMNEDAQIFNEGLVSIVKQFNEDLIDANFTYVNPFRSAPGSKSFKDMGLIMDSSCCKVKEGEELCIPNVAPCADRNKYAFWDAVHPTEFISNISARVAYGTSNPFNANPWNISTLARP